MSRVASAKTSGSASDAPARSTGFDVAAAGPSSSDSLRAVSSDSSASVAPPSTRRSLARAPWPPPSVRIAMPLPSGQGGWFPSVSATCSSSSVRVTSTTPACRSPAARRSYGPATEPVCESAAAEPASVRPLFTTTIGFFRTTRDAVSSQARARGRASRYAMMARVGACSSSQARASSEPTSSWFPTPR